MLALESCGFKFKFSRIKVYLVVEYGPNEGVGEERERLWNDMDRNRVGNGYRLSMPGYLNGWIRDRVRAGITGASRVPVENKN